MPYTIESVDVINPLCSVSSMCGKGRGCKMDPAFCDEAKSIRSGEAYNQDGGRRGSGSGPGGFTTTGYNREDDKYMINTGAAGDYLSAVQNYTSIEGSYDLASAIKSYDIGGDKPVMTSLGGQSYDGPLGGDSYQGDPGC